jgi:hypothetical protein
MEEEKPKEVISLKDREGIISYSVRIEPSKERFDLYFEDGTVQTIYSFQLYIYELSYYYRRRFDSIDSMSEKIEICETFLNTAYMYLTDWRNNVRDQESFLKDLQLHIKQFEYFKTQFMRHKDLNTTNTKKEELDLKEKIIILNYIGALDLLKQSNQGKTAKLVSCLLGCSYDNVKKSISGINGKPKASDAIKTTKTLNRVLSFAQNHGFKDLESKALADLDKIN